MMTTKPATHHREDPAMSVTLDRRFYTCSICSFSTSDIHLLERHSCSATQHGGYCEDYPCCGHEQGDCNGLLYGSDEAIKEDAMRHIDCDHENGDCRLWGDGEDDDDEA